MTESEFKRQYLGDFKIDESTLQLEKRLLQYYEETENCDNSYALTRWKEFKRWACGYTNEEINQAKRSVIHLVK